MIKKYYYNYQTLPTYKVTFDVNGVLTEKEYNAGDKVLLTDIPTPGEHFLKWFETTDRQLYTSSEILEISVDRDYTYLALYEEPFTITLTYFSLHLKFINSISTYDILRINIWNDGINTTGIDYTDPENCPKGYYFIGWGSTLRNNENLELNITGERTFFNGAIFLQKCNQFTINLDAWCEYQEYSNLTTLFEIGDTYDISKVNSTLYFYPIFRKRIYKLTYSLSNIGFQDKYEYYEYGTSINITEVCSNKGYTFEGWTLDKLTESIVSNIIITDTFILYPVFSCKFIVYHTCNLLGLDSFCSHLKTGVNISQFPSIPKTQNAYFWPFDDSSNLNIHYTDGYNNEYQGLSLVSIYGGKIDCNMLKSIIDGLIDKPEIPLTEYYITESGATPIIATPNNETTGSKIVEYFCARVDSNGNIYQLTNDSSHVNDIQYIANSENIINCSYCDNDKDAVPMLFFGWDSCNELGNVFHIAYNLDGGSCDSEYPNSYRTSSTDYYDLSTYEEPTKPGYTFEGWSKLIIDGRIDIGDLLITAIWSKNLILIEYIIKNADTVVNTIIDNYWELDKYAILRIPVISSYYIFKGWEKGIVNYLPGSILYLPGQKCKITFTGHYIFSTENASITFSSTDCVSTYNNHSLIGSQIAYNISNSTSQISINNQLFGEMSPNSKDRYLQCILYRYNDGMTNINTFSLPTIISYPINNFYAIFSELEKNHVILTYDYSEFKNNEFTICILADTIVLPNPNISGYIFDGWYYDSTFTLKCNTYIQINSDTTIYAKFIEIPTACINIRISKEEWEKIANIVEFEKLICDVSGNSISRTVSLTNHYINLELKVPCGTNNIIKFVDYLNLINSAKITITYGSDILANSILLPGIQLLYPVYNINLDPITNYLIINNITSDLNITFSSLSSEFFNCLNVVYILNVESYMDFLTKLNTSGVATFLIKEINIMDELKDKFDCYLGNDGVKYYPSETINITNNLILTPQWNGNIELNTIFQSPYICFLSINKLSDGSITLDLINEVSIKNNVNSFKSNQSVTNGYSICIDTSTLIFILTNSDMLDIIIELQNGTIKSKHVSINDFIKTLKLNMEIFLIE